jgi:protein-S-isoprenylcysteine O-methyltransferase Ste14
MPARISISYVCRGLTRRSSGHAGSSHLRHQRCGGAPLNLVVRHYRRLMQALELKIPPPVVALLVAVAMWGISWAMPSAVVPMPIRVSLAIVIALAGVGIAISGALAFRRARTTVSPLKPETTSSLVTDGAYRFTRNPMYVGVALVLVAWAVFLISPLALLGPLVFILYIGRFQIVPEERVLSALFGAAYSAYRAKVRRWI